MRRRLAGWMLAVSCLLVSSVVKGDSDVELWSEVGVRYKLSKPWRISLTQGLRLDERWTRFGQALTEAEVRLRLAPWFAVGSGYRFAYRQLASGDMAVRHRVHAETVARVERGSVRVSYRARLQQQLRGSLAMDGVRYVIRQRAKLAWAAARRVDLHTSGEVFVLLADEEVADLDAWRATAGVEYATKTQTLEIFYRLAVPLADDDDPVAHIIGVGVSFAR